MQLEMNLSADNGSRSWAAWVAVGAVLGLLGVAMGAAGTHVLEGRLDADALDTLKTAVRFQMYHAIALVAVGGLGSVWRSRAVTITCGLLILGIIVFCGSLYLIALADISAFGAIAPVGGLSLMAGWGTLAVGTIRYIIGGKAR